MVHDGGTDRRMDRRMVGKKATYRSGLAPHLKNGNIEYHINATLADVLCNFDVILFNLI